ncbi:MAG: hypothetical protein LUQ67_03195 [Methanomicrobiales archaeon]|nr:hypothetical protein [Methanomicrobiales archaeon]
MVRRTTTPVHGGREEELFRKGMEIADALKEVPEVAATEYRAGEAGIRVIFAVPDRHAGDLIRRVLEKFRITPSIPGAGYRLGIYDVDDRNVLLFLDTKEAYAGAIRDAVKAIRRC